MYNFVENETKRFATFAKILISFLMLEKLPKMIKQPAIIIALLSFLLPVVTNAQVYKHEFDTAPTSGNPTYNVAPTILDGNLSNSIWTNSLGDWTSFTRGTGRAIGLTDSSGNPVITLTFTVAPQKQLEITAFDFWRQRSNTGAQNWSLAINGTAVGNGSVPTSGAAIGNTPVSTAVAGLTGNVTVTLTLSGASSSGTFRLDDFTLFGTVTSTCTAPVISSVLPVSGPVGTVVTINGSGFSAGTGTSSVLFNGVAASSFTVVSDTQIKAVAPVSATGTIKVTTNNCTGESTFSYTYLTNSCPGVGTATDLFISEIYDDQAGEGGAVEFYNGTAATIDLSQYTLERYGNIGDATPVSTFTLSGMLAPGQIYIATRSNGLTCTVTTPLRGELPEGFNDNDEFKLLKNGSLIDRVEMPNNRGYSMYRLNTAVPLPNPVYNVADWTISNTETCADLGIYNMPTTPQASITTQPQSTAVCNNSQAVFTAVVQNATGYTYQWKTLDAAGNWVNVTNDATYSGAQTATLTVNAVNALNGKKYYLEVTSATCTLISNAAQLTVNPGPTLPAFTTTPVTCLIPLSILTVTPTAGLQFSMDGTNFVTTNVFINLTAGSYTLYVKDINGCINSTPFTIAPAATGPAAPTYTATTLTCNNPTATITVDPVAGLEYSIDGTNFSSNNIFNGLTANTYTITVRNANGCTNSTPVTIAPAAAGPAVPTYTATALSCTVSTATITVDPVAGLEYSIDGTNFTTNNVFTGLAANIYTITVRNADGCTNSTSPFVIAPAPATPAVPTYTATTITCGTTTATITVDPVAGLEYSIDGINFGNNNVFSGLAANTYTITVRNAAGCTNSVPVTITLGPSTPATPTYTATTLSCAVATATITVDAVAGLEYSIDGTNFSSNNVFSNLSANTYTITVRNAAGCTNSTPVTIAPATPGPAVPVYNVSTINCANDTATINVTPVAGLEYSLNGGAFTTNPVFSGLNAGNYEVTVKNALGCTNTTGNITIAPAPALPVFGTFEGCATSTAGRHFMFELTSEGAFDFNTLNYQWKTANGATVSTDGPEFDVTKYANDNNITVFPITLQLTITTAQGCTASYNFEATGTACDIPRGISPNGDNRNDEFDLAGFNVEKLTIFNRYGLEVYHKTNYTNEWHGQTDNGDELPTGTYFYMVKTATESKTGWVYINRP